MIEYILGFIVLTIILGVIAVTIATSVKFVRPTHRALIERMGKYNRFVESGVAICVPFLERIRLVNVTERLVTCNKQEVITADNLNAGVAAQVYYRIRGDRESVKNSQYNVDNINLQIVALAQTTLRNVIGELFLRDANSKRGEVNVKLKNSISVETTNWGIDVVRTEIAEIDAPEDVQKSMNNIVKAESDKRAAIDFATAVETKADGEKRAEIKRAEGRSQAIKIEADAKAEAIRTVNNAANETFTGPAVELKKLEVGEKVFQNNSKVIVPSGTDITTLITDLTGTEKVVPVVVKG